MRALKFQGPGKIELVEIDRPVPQKGEVLVKVRTATICASDIKILHGIKKARIGVTLGHEVAGEIEESKAQIPMKCGDRVVIYPSIYCGNCVYCHKELFHLCLNKKTIGYSIDGGFADFILLPPEMVKEGALLKLENVEINSASLIEPLATVIASIERADLKEDSTVLVTGAGGMGLMHIMIIRALLSDCKIYVVEPEKLRRERALEFGADFAVHPDEIEQILEETDGIGVDVAFITTWAPDGLLKGVRLTRKRGKIVAFSSYKNGTIPLEVIQNLHYAEKELLGVHSASPKNFKKAHELAEKGIVNLGRLISHRFRLDEYSKAFEVAQSVEAIKVAFIL